MKIKGKSFLLGKNKKTKNEDRNWYLEKKGKGYLFCTLFLRRQIHRRAGEIRCLHGRRGSFELFGVLVVLFAKASCPFLQWSEVSLAEKKIFVKKLWGVVVVKFLEVFDGCTA